MQTPKVSPILLAPILDFTKLYAGSSRIAACEKITYTDDLNRVITIHYRVINACPNAQTDVSCDCYTIELVTYQWRKVNLSGRGEQSLLEWLNETNPAGIL